MRLCSLLGIKYPIIQAPMAGADTPELAAAVSNASGMGSLGAQYKAPEQIRDAIQQIRLLTAKPFCVNLFALPPLVQPSIADVEIACDGVRADYEKFNVKLPTVDEVVTQIDADEQLDVLLEEKIPAFSFTLGMLSDHRIRAFKQAGITVMGTATNVDEAKQLADSGVDAIIVQGSEAGGHRGTFVGPYENSMIGLMALIPQVVDAVDIPVIAAGGIMDGRGLVAALALGADGVQMGTAFLTTTECGVHYDYKRRIMNSKAEDTTITKAFSGGAARGIRNDFIRKHDAESNATLLQFPFHNAVTRPLRNFANKNGELEYTNLWCGQAGQLAKSVSCKELIEQIMDSAKVASSRVSVD